MRVYPSIEGPSKAPHKPCYCFTKYDGSSVRFEWSSKRGWYKFGTRHCMIDHTDPIFGPAVPLFLQKYGDDLEKVFKTEKAFRGVRSFIVFGEYFGEKSFAGMHFPDEQKWDVVLFDVNPHKQGILGPKEFLDAFGHLKVAECLGVFQMGEELIQNVRKERLDCESKYPVKTEIPEGVICKGLDGRHKLWMAKIKTERYKEELKKRYRTDWISYWGLEDY